MMLERKTRGTLAICTAVLFVHYLAGLFATQHKSATFDEPLHITGGYTYNRFHDYRIHPENGLLPQRWAALPLSFQSLNYSTEHPAWLSCERVSAGYQFFYSEQNDPAKILWSARAMNGLWSVALGALVFIWTRRLLGAWPSWLSLTLWATSPLFLAHGFLATSDACAAFFFLAAIGSLWTLLHRWTWLTWLASSGALIGLFLAKYSAPLIFPMAIILGLIRLIGGQPWTIDLYGKRILQRRWRHAAAIGLMIVSLGLVTWLGVWAGYGFRYSAFHSKYPVTSEWMPSWSDMLGKPGFIRESVGWAREKKLLPEGYLFGFLYTFQHSQLRRAFLLGEYSITGWTKFFPFCELMKSPSGVFVVFGTAAWMLASRFRSIEKGRWRWLIQGFYKTTPWWTLVFVYWTFALTSHLNIGHRHVLPAEAPMYCLLGIAAWCLPRTILKNTKHNSGNPLRIFAGVPQRSAIVLLALGWISVIVGPALAWPNYLTYFNQLVGGPKQGWKLLVDSSLDWGQDLPGLADWIKAYRRTGHEQDKVYLSYFGLGSPKHHQIDAVLLPCHIEPQDASVPVPLEPGMYCLSASMLQGVFTDAPGRWEEQYETLFQSTMKDVAGFREAMAVSDMQRMWEGLSQEKKQHWLTIFSTYEALRLTRLTHYLRHREPDEHVNYSILIYRVTQADLDVAFSQPVHE
jgi:hypothetical protein